MATSNKREVELVIGVETTGQQSVKALSDAVSTLAKEGGEAAPEFQKLAAELDKVAQQQNAIDAFVEVRRQVAAMGAEMQEASATVDRLGTELPQAAAATRSFAEAQQAAAAALAAAKADLQEMRNAQQALREEFTGSARRTDEYRAANEQLKVTLRDLRAEVTGKRQALRDAEAATREAAAAERALSNAYNQSLNAAKELSGEMARSNATLDRSRDALRAVGIETTNLNAAQQQVRASFTQIREATERLVDSEQQLAEAQRLLNAELEIGSAAQREAAAADELRIRTAQEQARALRAAAAESAAALDAAFAKTGVRSAEAVEREIREVNEALNKLAFNARVSGAEFDRAFAAGQARIQKLQAELQGVPEQVNKTGAAAGYLKQQFSQLAAIYGGIELARAFIDANVQLETMRRSLTVITGSTQAAAAQIDFLRETANRAGVSVSGITDAFIRFNASAATAGVSTQTVNQVFGAITQAGGKLGLSTERVALSLEALGQIASKGTVSMEELRGQLGDSFPGALSIASKALGVTQAELVKLVESGQVLAEDFLPAFGKAIEREFGGSAEQIDGISQAWNRFKNVMTGTAQALGDGAIFKGLMTVLVVLGDTIRDLSVAAVGFDQTLRGIGRTVGLIAAALTGNIESFRAFKDELSTIWEEAGSDIQKFKEQTYATADGLKVVGDSTTLAGGLMRASLPDIQANAQAHQQVATAAGSNATAQTSAGTAAAASGAQALEGARGWYALLTAYNQAKTAAEVATSAAVKNAEAEKLRGDTMVRVAELSRDEVRAVGEAAMAATSYAASAQAVADARTNEVALTQNLIAALQQEIAAKGQATDGQSKQLAELRQVLDTKTAEAAKSLEAAGAARQEATERQIASQTYRDNADALGALRGAAETARVTLEALIAMEQQGQATAQMVTAARLEEARAMALYSDAVQDAAARAAALIQVQKAEASQVQANLSVEMARAEASESFARTYQNEGLLRSAQIEQRRIEVQMIQATAQAIVNEQTALIAKEQAAAAELERTGQMNATKQLEIDARIKAAQAKITEAEAGKAKIASLQNEITAIIQQGETQQRVSASNIAIIESETQARIRNADATRAEQQAAEEKAAFDRQHTVSDNTGLQSLIAKRDNGTLSQEDLAVAQTVYDVAKGNLTTAQQARPGTFALSGLDSVNADYQAARGILEQLQGGGGSLRGTPQREQRAQPGSSRTVNINMNGQRNTTIGVNSDADARNLESLLQQLSNGAKTSN